MKGKARVINEGKQSIDILLMGCIFAVLAVGLGAFGAHGLKDILLKYDRIQTFETAVQYHMFHSIGILIVALAQFKSKSSLKLVAFLFAAGIFVFSGSLYILSVTNFTWLGMITPIGGVSFILGWIILIARLWSIKESFENEKV